MATTARYNSSPMASESTLGSLWINAYKTLQEESETKLPLMNIDMIIAEQYRQVQLFDQFRHNKGKFDSLRSVMSRNTEVVQNMTSNVMTVASAGFPPSSIILTAFNLVLNASKAVSDDYDTIVTFFEAMNSFLRRISMLDRTLPPVTDRSSLLSYYHINNVDILICVIGVAITKGASGCICMSPHPLHHCKKVPPEGPDAEVGKGPL